MGTRTLTMAASGLPDSQQLLLSSIVRAVTAERQETGRWVPRNGDISFVPLDSAMGRTLAETQKKRSRFFVPIVRQGQAVPQGIEYYLRYPFKATDVAELMRRARERVDELGVDTGETPRSGTTRRNIRVRDYLCEFIVQSQRMDQETFSAGEFGSISFRWRSGIVQTSGDFADTSKAIEAIIAAGRGFHHDSDGRTDNGAAFSLTKLLWEFGLTCSSQANMINYMSSHLIHLIRWPDFSVVTKSQDHIRLLSLMSRKPVTVEFLESHSGLSREQILSVTGACIISGLTEVKEIPEQTLTEQAPGPQVRPPRFIARIRKALRIGSRGANAT